MINNVLVNESLLVKELFFNKQYDKEKLSIPSEINNSYNPTLNDLLLTNKCNNSTNVITLTPYNESDENSQFEIYDVINAKNPNLNIAPEIMRKNLTLHQLQFEKEILELRKILIVLRYMRSACLRVWKLYLNNKIEDYTLKKYISDLEELVESISGKIIITTNLDKLGDDISEKNPLYMQHINTEVINMICVYNKLIERINIYNEE
jgi:hypothetical protein